MAGWLDWILGYVGGNVFGLEFAAWFCGAWRRGMAVWLHRISIMSCRLDDGWFSDGLVAVLSNSDGGRVIVVDNRACLEKRMMTLDCVFVFLILDLRSPEVSPLACHMVDFELLLQWLTTQT